MCLLSMCRGGNAAETHFAFEAAGFGHFATTVASAAVSFTFSATIDFATCPEFTLVCENLLDKLAEITASTAMACL